MGRHLTSEETAIVIRMHNEGHTQKEIATYFNVGQSTIHNKLAIFRDENRINRKKTIRPIKADREVLSQIQNHVESDPYATLKEVKQELDLPCTTMTISNYIKRLGLKSGISPRKFLVKHLPVEARIEFASLMRRLSAEQWKKYIFTDESGMDNSGYFRKRVWRPRGERFNHRYVLKHQNSTMSRVNYFSWISPTGTGDLYFYDKMDSETYCEIILDMIQKLKAQYGSEDFYVIHDNARFANQCTQDDS